MDGFEKGKRIPSCQLIARCQTEQPTDLEQLVTLSGAKVPHHAFTIYRPRDAGSLYSTIMYIYTIIILKENNLSQLLFFRLLMLKAC